VKKLGTRAERSLCTCNTLGMAGTSGDVYLCPGLTMPHVQLRDEEDDGDDNDVERRDRQMADGVPDLQPASCAANVEEELQHPDISDGEHDEIEGRCRDAVLSEDGSEDTDHKGDREENFDDEQRAH